MVQRPECPLCDDEPASREAAIILAYFRRQKMLADPSQMLRAPGCPKCPLSNASRRDPDASRVFVVLGLLGELYGREMS